jgi:pimeloyl-ACP methyl ester carboxylesterase
MRQDLAELRAALDPEHREPALDDIVLVGHSMGGLVSKLQVVDSGDSFWHIVSNQPFEVVKAEPDVRGAIERTLFFHANPSIRRVVTIGTPHRGSDFANDTTRWLFRKVIKLPDMFVTGRQKLLRDNPGVFRESTLLEIDTSIDSLAPSSPFLPVLLAAQPASGVKLHNIIGEVPDSSFLRRVSGTSDGVVRVDSARLDQAVSEIIVTADHSQVHRHPRSILEVRRILLEQLAELDSLRYQRPAVDQTTSAAPWIH